MELLKIPENAIEIIDSDDYDEVIVAKQTGMPTSRAIEAIALRVEAMHAATIAASQEKISHADIVLVTEVAIGMGHNPLSRDFHFWKFREQMQIADHYAFMVGWARSIENFREIKEVRLIEDGDDRKKWYWECKLWLIRDGQNEHYSRIFTNTLKILVDAGMDRLEAIKLAKQAALGEFPAFTAQLEYTRVYSSGNNGWYLNSKNTPTGWVPGETRVYVRALRAAIRHSYGTPSQVERMNYGRVNLVKLMQAVDNIPVADPVTIERMAELVAGNDNVTSLSKGERMGLMQPQDEGAVGEDYTTPISNRPPEWWETVTGTPDEIVAAALDRAHIKNDPKSNKKKSAREDTVAWLVGPEVGHREARAVAWFCDAIAGGKIDGDRILDFGVTPGQNATETKLKLKSAMEKKLTHGEF